MGVRRGRLLMGWRWQYGCVSISLKLSFKISILAFYFCKVGPMQQERETALDHGKLHGTMTAPYNSWH
jgi:hypothetical protein